MSTFIARRLFYAIPILFMVTVVIFILMWLQPGTVVDVICGLGCDHETIEQMEIEYGLDQPVYVQFFRWISGVVTRLDFGYSHLLDKPILDALIGEGRLFYSILLISTSMLLNWMIAIPIGI